MSRLLSIVIFSLGLFLPGNHVNAQKKQKTNKGTSKREIEKRLEESAKKDDTNYFNPLQPMGVRQNNLRDDLLWSSETANTGYEKSGNISLTTPSRYGLKGDLELYSTLGYDYWVPNVGIKKRWSVFDGWFIGSKHMLFSGTPGFNWAQNQGHNDIVDQDVEIPYILSMRNEFLASYVFVTKVTCTKPKPWLILTGAIGGDYGHAIVGNSLREVEGHFLTNRSPATTGSSWVAFAKIRADWQALNFLAVRGGVTYFYGDFTNNDAIEHRLYGELFAFPYLSFSGGYMMSFANYKRGGGFQIIPFVDLTLYFGRKRQREEGLWGKKGPK